MYQAFRDNGCNIDGSLNKAKELYSNWINHDYSIDTNRLVDYICNNNIDLSINNFKDVMTDFFNCIAI